MVWDFLYEYYIGPIINGEAYTIVDTLTYAVILVIAVFLIYRWLTHTGIGIDRDFVLATLPYVVLGGLLRVVEDTGIIPYPYYVLLVTPLIYFVIAFYAVAVLMLSWNLELRGIISNYSRGFAAGGIAACLISVVPLIAYGLNESRIALDVFAAILLMALGSTLAVWAVLRYVFRWEYASDLLYRLLIFGHMFDASATSFGIDIHEKVYVEQHVVGSALIDTTGTAFSMFALKLAVIVPAIYVLEMYRKEGNIQFWHLILLAMIVVGLAPGIRDMVRMVLYV